MMNKDNIGNLGGKKRQCFCGVNAILGDILGLLLMKKHQTSA